MRREILFYTDEPRYLAYLYRFTSEYDLPAIRFEPHHRGSRVFATNGFALCVFHFGCIVETPFNLYLTWENKIKLLNACRASIIKNEHGDYHLVTNTFNYVTYSEVDLRLNEGHYDIQMAVDAFNEHRGEVSNVEIDLEALDKFKFTPDAFFNVVNIEFSGPEGPIYITNPTLPFFYGLLMPCKTSQEDYG